jgi:hypothetical protein
VDWKAEFKFMTGSLDYLFANLSRTATGQLQPLSGFQIRDRGCSPQKPVHETYDVKNKRRITSILSKHLHAMFGCKHDMAQQDM